MSSFVEPPKWDPEHKSFEFWLKECELWKMCTVDNKNMKDKHAMILIAKLPQDCEIRQLLFDQLTLDEMKGSDGWTAMIKIFKEHFETDETARNFEIWNDFIQYKRGTSQSIDDYIVAYEKHKARMRGHGMDIDNKLHAFILLGSANLSPDDLKITLREVDLTKANDNDMYDKAKMALRKYMGHSSIVTSMPGNKSDKTVSLVKDNGDETFISMTTEEFDTYLSFRRNNSNTGTFYKNNNSFRGGNRQGMSSFRKNYGAGSFNKGASSSRNFKRQLRERVVPALPNGMRCYTCGADNHLERDCPTLVNPGEHVGRGSGSYVSFNNYLPVPYNSLNFSTKLAYNDTYRTPNADTGKAHHNLIECDITSHNSHSLNFAILDTGCLLNVAGRLWANGYVDSLEDCMRERMKRDESVNRYKFGGGRVCQALYQLSVPVLVAGCWKSLVFDVVDSDIPLLLGKRQWKDWDIKLDAGRDVATVSIDGVVKDLPLCVSGSGHWCVDLTPGMPSNTLDALFSVRGKTLQEKKKAALHLHRALVHPSFSTMKKSLAMMDDRDAEFEHCVKEVTDNCKTCKVHGTTRPRPAVSGLTDPEKMERNHVVSLDLKQWGDRHILYMIDMVTRYTRANFVPSKNKETIVNMMLKEWVSIFGAPSMFYSDGGGEFANKELKELGNTYGILIRHTPAYSPWANGLNERNHATVDFMLKKMMSENYDIPVDMALQYAVAVKNNFMFVDGFTPVQLMFGRAPRMPLTTDDNLPALEGVSSSKIMADNLNALAAAKEAFIKAEISGKLRKALAHPVRSYVDAVYKRGDLVYYKICVGARKFERWEGPATVIGVEGKSVVVIKIGNTVRNVHPRNVQHVERPLQGKVFPNSESSDPGDDRHRERVEVEKPQSSKASQNADSGGVREVSAETGEESADDDSAEIPQADTVLGSSDTAGISGTVGNRHSDAVNLPIRSAKVRYRSEPAGDWTEVSVLGRAGKATGGNKYWLNVEDKEGHQWSMDWSRVEAWEPCDRTDASNETHSGVVNAESENLVLAVLDKIDEFHEAKMEELQRLHEFKAYSVLSHDDLKPTDKILTGRWVTTRKKTDKGWINRARFVIRGFEENLCIQSDSPTVSKECLHLIFTIASSKDWTINTIDIKSAFLQGKMLERDVFVRPPREALLSKDSVWKLEKSVYGLNDAARNWYMAVFEELHSLGCRRSEFDYGVFTWYKNGGLAGILLSHVDDFIWAGTVQFKTVIIDSLCKKFRVGSMDSEGFTYIGIKVEQNQDGVFMDQIEYINNVDEVSVDRQRKKEKDKECTEQEATLFRCLIGKLNWVSCQTRPDASFGTCQLSARMKKPLVKDVLAANKLLNRLKCDPLAVKYPKLPRIENSVIYCYGDASLGNLESGKSAEGFVVFVVDKNSGKSCPIMWKTKTIKRVVRSTLAAETTAAVDGLDNAFFISKLLFEMLFGNSAGNPRNRTDLMPMFAFTDNDALYRNAHSTTMVREKRVQIDLAVIKQMLERGELASFKWIPAGKQLADVLTKQGADPLKLALAFESGKLE